METNKKNISKFKVLLIEDEPRFYYRQIREVEKSGEVELIKAINYEAIKKRLTENTYDLIIFDIMAPFSEFTSKDTDSGIKTGLMIYKKLEIDKLFCKIIIWTRNSEMLDKNLWGNNVIKTVLKDGTDDFQLLEIIKQNLK